MRNQRGRIVQRAPRLALGLGLLCVFLAVAWQLWADEPMKTAAYVGPEACVECHEEQVEEFSVTVHGRSELQGWNGATGCESCHGPGSTHVDSGEPEDIGNFLSASTWGNSMAGSDSCLGCHRSGGLDFWHGSAHQAENLSCADCHTVHQPWTQDHALTNRNTNESCLECHTEMRKHMLQRSRHPLREGLMSCVDCHSPHGSPGEHAMKQATVNQQCYECHAELRGPFLWEHAPVRENCLICHDPHGSNEANMLVKAAPRMCQSCHQFGHHQTVAGEPTQVWNMNNSCVNCHHNIHGSNHPSGVIYMQ